MSDLQTSTPDLTDVPMAAVIASSARLAEARARVAAEACKPIGESVSRFNSSI
jgi:FXSXX-COOH protein